MIKIRTIFFRDTKGQYRPIPYNPHDRQYNFEENYDMREKEKSLSYRGNKKDPALHIHVPGSPVRVSYSPQNPMSNKPYYGHYMISPPESQEQYYHPTYQYSQYPPFSPGYESKSNSSMSYTDQRGNYNTSPKDSYQSGQRSPPRSARSQDPPDGYIYQVNSDTYSIHKV